MNQHRIENIYDLISLLKSRTAMYTGNNKLSTLRTFIDGFQFALSVNQLENKDHKPIPFVFFHEWVARYYNWYESTAGWCHIILEENNHDEEKSLTIFFDLFDQFSQMKILSTQQLKLNQQNIDFHHSAACKTKRIADIKLWTEVPLYENPTEINLLELSDFGFIYNVLNNEKDWERKVYRSELAAKEEIESLFGSFSAWRC